VKSTNYDHRTIILPVVLHERETVSYTEGAEEDIWI